LPYEVWLSEEAVRDLKLISKEPEKKLLWWHDKLTRDVIVGDNIRRSLIPTALRRKYEINNLWRLELPGGWRALYTVASKPAEKPKVSILRIMSHKDYDRLFGYSSS
jgi:hypothetical protein